jgi:hypothetical protein
MPQNGAWAPRSARRASRRHRGRCPRGEAGKIGAPVFATCLGDVTKDACKRAPAVPAALKRLRRRLQLAHGEVVQGSDRLVQTRVDEIADGQAKAPPLRSRSPAARRSPSRPRRVAKRRRCAVHAGSAGFRTARPAAARRSDHRALDVKLRVNRGRQQADRKPELWRSPWQLGGPSPE